MLFIMSVPPNSMRMLASGFAAAALSPYAKKYLLDPLANSPLFTKQEVSLKIDAEISHDIKNKTSVYMNGLGCYRPEVMAEIMSNYRLPANACNVAKYFSTLALSMIEQKFYESQSNLMPDFSLALSRRNKQGTVALMSGYDKGKENSVRNNWEMTKQFTEAHNAAYGDIGVKKHFTAPVITCLVGAIQGSAGFVVDHGFLKQETVGYCLGTLAVIFNTPKDYTYADFALRSSLYGGVGAIGVGAGVSASVGLARTPSLVYGTVTGARAIMPSCCSSNVMNFLAINFKNCLLRNRYVAAGSLLGSSFLAGAGYEVGEVASRGGYGLVPDFIVWMYKQKNDQGDFDRKYGTPS